jgi:hypothetical protein
MAARLWNSRIFWAEGQFLGIKWRKTRQTSPIATDFGLGRGAPAGNGPERLSNF